MEIRQHLDNLYSKNAELRYASFQHLLRETEEPVAWTGIAWDDLLALLHGDNHQRAIAAQLMSNLAKSDPKRMLASLDRVMQITRDEKFVTARHALQSLWKPAVVNQELRDGVVKKLSHRFNECGNEKNCTLIRYDIIEVFRKIYNHVPDETVKKTALALIETEDDMKYKKKYTGLWKDILKTDSANAGR